MHHDGHEREPIVVVQSIHLAKVEVGQAILTVHQQITGVGVRMKKTDLEELARGALDALLDDALLLGWRGARPAPFI